MTPSRRFSPLRFTPTSPAAAFAVLDAPTKPTGDVARVSPREAGKKVPATSREPCGVADSAAREAAQASSEIAPRRARLPASTSRRRRVAFTPDELVRCLALTLATVLTAPAAVGCARARAGEPSATPGDPQAIATAQRALEETLADGGASSDRVIGAAEALIETQPDPATAARAWLLKANAHFSQGDDTSAMQAAMSGLELDGGTWLSNDPPVAPASLAVSDRPGGLDTATREGLEQVWIRAMVRGGDPARAAAVVRALWAGAGSRGGAAAGSKGKATGATAPLPVTGPRVFTVAEWRGLLAIAEHRRGKTDTALLALAAWRSTLSAGDPGTAWAETMLGESAAAIQLAETRRDSAHGNTGPSLAADIALAGLDDAQRGAVSACLQRAAMLGASVEDGGPAAEPTAAPRWTERCVGPRRSIGVLLPRAGKLSALTDAQLEAIEVGLGLIAQTTGGRGGAASAAPRVTWLDAGGDEAGMRRAGSAAIRGGISTVIGPVGHDTIALAARVLPGLTLVVPGEVTAPTDAVDATRGGSRASRLIGVAPPLEARVGALVQTLKAEGITRVVILAPASSYGQRAAAAAKASSRESGLKSTEFIEYPIGTTSFSGFTDPLRGANAEVAILVFDALPRVEAVLRQLRRDGVVGGAKGARFGTTAEGFDPSRLTAARGVFEGALMAPVAFVAHDDPFARAFSARFGREPSDHAVLAWRALLRATGGGDTASLPSSAILGIVKGDRLVPR